MAAAALTIPATTTPKHSPPELNAKRSGATNLSGVRPGSRIVCRAVQSSSPESVQTPDKISKKKKTLPHAAWPVFFYRDWVDKFGSSKFHGEDDEEGEADSEKADQSSSESNNSSRGSFDPVK